MDAIPFSAQTIAILVLSLLALAGLLALFVTLRRLRARRILAAGTAGLSALLLLGLAGLAAALLLNLQTYRRFTHETPVADLRVMALGPHQFRVTLFEPEGLRHFDLRGDDWQLDARVIKWRGFATWLGLDPLYRLDRLSGRYRDIEAEQRAPRTAHALADEPGLNVWRLSERLAPYLPWLDAYYGSATYLPLADGAHYRVTLSATGLLARPANAIAEEAVGRWR